jgi:hypothetical protein
MEDQMVRILIVSGILALLMMAVTACTCSRDKGLNSLTPPEGACAESDQLGGGSCDQNTKKLKMEKRRTLKIDPRRFTLNRDLLNGTVRKQLQDEGKLPPDGQKPAAPADTAVQPQKEEPKKTPGTVMPVNNNANMRPRVPIKVVKPAAPANTPKEPTP